MQARALWSRFFRPPTDRLFAKDACWRLCVRSSARGYPGRNFRSAYELEGRRAGAARPGAGAGRRRPSPAIRPVQSRAVASRRPRRSFRPPESPKRASGSAPRGVAPGRIAPGEPRPGPAFSGISGAHRVFAPAPPARHLGRAAGIRQKVACKLGNTPINRGFQRFSRARAGRKLRKGSVGEIPLAKFRNLACGKTARKKFDGSVDRVRAGEYIRAPPTRSRRPPQIGNVVSTLRGGLGSVGFFVGRVSWSAAL
jgi:hypothetical protein